MPDLPLLHSHAVVTGAGRGIGAAIAHALAAQGAHLTLMSRTLDQLEKVKASLTLQSDQKVFTQTVDVSDPESIKSAFTTCKDALGAPEILVNNAGSVTTSPAHKISLKDWEFCQQVNLRGPFLAIQEVLPAMLKAQYGRIVNIASTAGVTGYRYTAHYCAAKHGVVGLTRSMALELTSNNITVNAVCPGFTDTPMLKNSLEAVSQKTGQSIEELEQQILKDVPLGRLIRPEEVAESVAWLCQKSQAAISGQTITVAGGEVL